VSAEVKKEIELEIAYVLFVDIVGYSKLLIDQQRRLLELLNEIVRGTEQFRKAEASHRLITIPTGDGMALVFYNAPEAPVECALEISRAAREHPELKLRMGVHSGPVSGVVDVSGRANIAGAGINIAQRVMDCGDAEHILLSKHVAEDLEQLGHWKKHLHDLGAAEVKHGAHVSVVNLYTEELGNPEVPQKFLQARHKAAAVPVAPEKPRTSRSWIIAAAALLLIGGLALGGYFLSRRSTEVGTERRAVHENTTQTEGRAGPANVASLPTSAAPAAFPEKSIAVLPFENLSRDPDNAFFTDGVQDEILTDLSKIADLKVISRTSVMQYKTGTPRNLREIAQQLGVAHLVEGSVQRVSNRVRVNAQLIDARNDAHLWAQTYDRDLADVFAIQSEIAKAIADQLQAKLSPAEKNAIEQRPTSDIAAFELYSRANDLILNIGFSSIQVPNVHAGIDLLNQALARDPSFFAAQCQLARAHDTLYALREHTPEQRALAEGAIKAAFQLRPDAGEAHLARANHLYSAYRDYDGALAELDIVRSKMPNAPRIFEITGYIARRRGAHEAGVRNLEHAVELDPRNFFTLQQLALSYKILRRYAEEVATLDRALSIKPDDPEARGARGLAFFDWKADTQTLHQTIDEIRTQNPEVVKSVADVWFICALAEHDAAAAEAALAALGDGRLFGANSTSFDAGFGRGLLARMLRDQNKARSAFSAIRPEQEKIIQSQPDYAPPVCILALIDAGLGRKEEAEREIRHAVDLVPMEKDSLNGADMIQYSAIVAAWVGEKDLALQNLAKAAQLPGFVSYGRLKLLPWYDPLRGDPRFEKIVASLAPKL
jgi:TolB-like protein/class 3 adenylate cyclase/Flp pilus assembly protein TadD